jgi:hypothetical protein
MRLLRVGGVAEELLAHARGGHATEIEAAFADHVCALADEVQAVVCESDPLMAEEFERVIGRGDAPADLRAAALVGWLNAVLSAESLTDQRAGSDSAEHLRRKQTIGFKLRSPVTREHAAPEQASDAT